MFKTECCGNTVFLEVRVSASLSISLRSHDGGLATKTSSSSTFDRKSCFMPAGSVRLLFN